MLSETEISMSKFSKELVNFLSSMELGKIHGESSFMTS